MVKILNYIVHVNNIERARARVSRGRSHPILSPSLGVVEQADVLPEFLETSDAIRNFVISFL